ncbi:MAG: RecQ family ATP-dependent DNA helicase [Desulfobacterales bacterium]|nr:RecQ family ATP-dependent DNA helicase [Desulfobacterales bacterium]
MQKFLFDDIVYLDIETGIDKTLFSVGAVRGEKAFSSTINGNGQKSIIKLDQFCCGASALCGHNITAHDLPVLKELFPRLGIHSLPAIDTLFFSPLAFPENPYHRLVKDYKLISSSKNNPVADSHLARSLLEDEIQSFQAMGEEKRFYAAAFSLAGKDFSFLAPFFKGPEETLDEKQAMALFFRIAKNRCCQKADLHAYQQEPDFWLAMAYTLSWITVSGGNSILPPWVRHRYPLVKSLLIALRETPCGNENCPWCQEMHNPKAQLKKYFGFEDFRVLPDGRPLQNDLVLSAIKGHSLIGILPTGGGKSLCYQLPALVRYQRRGLLTVIISPLQALMKDQVDNLQKRLGTHAAAYITGMLTSQERGAVLEAVRLGDIGLLYISPEQLRNRSVVNLLKTREIGCWVFDEAHCLSKWGHDFRPDYLYASRFILENHTTIENSPQITCYTATAKTEVIDELMSHFKERLAVELDLLQGGVERENLIFEIQTVTEAEKEEAIISLLEAYLGKKEKGAAIIYFSKRRRTEEFAESLSSSGWKALAFHAGLSAPEKKEVQNLFIQGEIPIITATNAFGMGIDKEDVRLVIHADIPGSLENYLQEAGRAGRDRNEAHCVLLYAEQDIETQFDFNALSELTQSDMQNILKELRAMAKKQKSEEVVITSGELLRRHNVEFSFSDFQGGRGDTLVKAAVSWLEQAGYVERNENQVSVFQGKPVHTTREEVAHHLDRLDLPHNTRKIWEAVLHLFSDLPKDEGLTADFIAETLGAKGVVGKEAFQNSRDILKLVHTMAEAGVLTKGATMTAWVEVKGGNKSRTRLDLRCDMEKKMLAILMEEHPEGKGHFLPISFTHLSRRMIAEGHEGATAPVLQSLMKSLSLDGRGEKGGASLDLKHLHQSRFEAKLKREWDDISRIMQRRHDLAYTLLDAIIEAAGGPSAPSGSQLASFTSTDLAEAIRKSLLLHVQEEKMLAAMDRGLLFLHEQEVIMLQKGLTVFRQAMCLKLKSDPKKRYTKKDFKPLEGHYSQKTFQVHVMNEYARQGLEKMGQALTMVLAYFSMSRRAFMTRYFKGREDLLALATGEGSLKTIVTDLKNQSQERVVTAPAQESRLVLAGPGSGKTRTVVHRCAYLVKIKRVRPESILILCFNHATAVELRKKIRELVPQKARGIGIMTYHGLALSITGRTPRGRGQDLENAFDRVIQEATAMLEGETSLDTTETDGRRGRLLGGIEHILVDEYQDINDAQYRLVAALAGKNREKGDGRLSLLAVGDDDQAIYGFRKADVAYIQKFASDYQADISHLVENYRSTACIIQASNALISQNPNRLKSDTPIVINKDRRKAPSGGRWDALDTEYRGQVRIVSAATLSDQAQFVAESIQRLVALDPGLSLSEIGVFSRHGINHPPLSFMRTALDKAGIPASVALDSKSGFSMHRTRLFLEVMAWLKINKTKRVTAEEIRTALDNDGVCTVPPNASQDPASRFILQSIDAWEDQTSGTRQQAGHLIDFLHSAAREERLEKRSGSGVFLSTAHGAKGLEFKHVFVLDKGWQTARDEIAEERRLYYVAMTRAMETLSLMEVSNGNNPHLAPIQAAPHAHLHAPVCPPLPSKGYTLLGMDALYVDYAGRMLKNATLHSVIKTIHPGDRLTLSEFKGTLGLWKNRHLVCRLSNEAAQKWRHRLGQIHSITVTAMVTRYQKDVKEGGFNEKICCEAWEIPVCEIVTKAE